MASDEQVEAVLLGAAYAVNAERAYPAGEIGRYDELDPAQVDRVVRGLLERLLQLVWNGGWQPNDVAEHARRRRLEGAAETLLAEAIGSQHRIYEESAVHPQWLDQLKDLGVDRRPLELTAWTQRHRLSRYLALEAAITVAAYLLSLQVLQRLLPLPGSYVGEVAAAGLQTADEKVLGRIRGLLAKAEATEFPDEAEALSAKAQELMAKFSLDLALVEALADEVEQVDHSAARRIWLETPYVSAKAQLVHAVAAANRCRTVSTDQLAFVTIIGGELDLQLTELLSTSLLVQASRAMLAAGQNAGRYSEARTRAYRQSFLVAYAHRIGERLQAAADETAAAVTDEDASRLLPVLTRRETQVDALFTRLFPKTVTRRTRVSSGAGWAAGRDAANRAQLDARRPLRR